jgi:hypothetical protein
MLIILKRRVIDCNSKVKMTVGDKNRNVSKIGRDLSLSMRR